MAERVGAFGLLSSPATNTNAAGGQHAGGAAPPARRLLPGSVHRAPLRGHRVLQPGLAVRCAARRAHFARQSQAPRLPPSPQPGAGRRCRHGGSVWAGSAGTGPKAHVVGAGGARAALPSWCVSPRFDAAEVVRQLACSPTHSLTISAAALSSRAQPAHHAPRFEIPKPGGRAACDSTAPASSAACAESSAASLPLVPLM